MHIYQVSIFFLGACSVLCMVGLVSPRFHDNLPMCVAMCLLSIGSASRAFDLAEQAPPDLAWDWFFVHVGVGLYAIGKFFDIYIRERRQRFAAFAHSTLERMQSAWRHAEATNHPILGKSAAEKITKR